MKGTKWQVKLMNCIYLNLKKRTVERVRWITWCKMLWFIVWYLVLVHSIVPLCNTYSESIRLIQWYWLIWNKSSCPILISLEIFRFEKYLIGTTLWHRSYADSDVREWENKRLKPSGGWYHWLVTFLVSTDRSISKISAQFKNRLLRSLH